MILIQQMHSSGILRFNDSVNDMSFWSKFKYTNKGPHSLGNNNSNNIGIRYRGKLVDASCYSNIVLKTSLIAGNSLEPKVPIMVIIFRIGQSAAKPLYNKGTFNDYRKGNYREIL